MNRAVPILMLASLLSASAFAGGGDKEYAVTITNITKAQIFAPTLVATHRENFHVFAPGEPALAELATQAEAGNPGPLQAYLDGMHHMVRDTNNSGEVLMPGESVTVMISGNSGYNHVSLTAMLVTTNDTFAGLNSVELPKSSGSYLIPAYDAGSEDNDELCDNIPGPPCGDMDDSGTATVDGVIYISSGIQGVGDVDAEDYDWRNPVALVEIRRVN